ncbi:hypothetical protein [Chitinophaga pinensis]|nr:hypothetical protein [Chitinophaga pinensis]
MSGINFLLSLFIFKEVYDEHDSVGMAGILWCVGDTPSNRRESPFESW